ncbi:MAG: AAA family ATPase [bacterium]
MSIKKQLPIGVSTLEEITTSNFLYIDKTKIIHHLITNNRRCFLSRPRRFGKSLLISTMKEIFLGNKALFKDLWLGQEGRYDFQERPVIHIDFSELDLTSHESIRSSLALFLTNVAIRYECNVSAIDSPETKLSILARHILAISSKKIVILIDEYDAPLLRHITDAPTAKTIRDMLSNFYATIKALDAYIHFTFVTGVTKFSKTSLFSGPNNLDDISLSEKYATLCGYTEKEILANFDGYIADCATTKHISPSAVMDEMRAWYNGYQMSDYLVEKVYNPFSVLLYLKHQKLKNYWFTTGTPTFLIKLIKDNLYNFTNVDHSETDSSMLDSFEVDKLPLKAILYQAGYLTIEKFNEHRHTHTLTYPNEEIRLSLNQTLLQSVLELKDESTQVLAHALRDALYTHNMAAFCTALQTLLAHIPHQLHIKEEAFYHALLQMICAMLGIDVTSEVSVASGSIDMILQTPATTYVFELKLNKSAKAAMKQIHARRYYEKYALNKKEIYLVGLAFNYNTKTLTHVVEKIDTKN